MLVVIWGLKMNIVNQFVVNEVGQRYLEVGRTLHFAADSIYRAFVSCPRTTAYTIVYIPEKHLPDALVAGLATIKYHAETAIDNFAPANAATIVKAYPRGTTERIADNILYGHVGTELRTVVDVACFAERRVGS